MGWENINNEPKSGGSGSDENITKFEVGTTKIRILGEAPHSWWQHWINNKNVSVVCPGKGCPICQLRAEDKANGVAARFSNSQRHAILIWNYATNRVEIMAQSTSFFSQLLAYKEEVGDLKTYDVKVIRKGEKLDTTYTVVPTSVSDFAFEKEAKEVDIDIPSRFPVLTNEEIIAILES